MIQSASASVLSVFQSAWSVIRLNFGGNSMHFFTVIILSGILCLFCFQMAQSAEMKVVDNNVYVNTE